MSQIIRSYSSYAPSPVPWLEDVPTEWKAIRLDRLFRYRSEEPLETDGRVTGYLDGRVTLRSNVAGQKIKGVVYETGWQRIHVGDFAISGMNAHLGGMGVSDSEGKCSPIYLVLEPLPDTNAHFVSLAVRHAAHLGAIKALVQTIRFNSADMKRADLKKIFVPVPSKTEQEQIVRFVRQLDSRVNRLIKAKRRLIELLNEQKQAIIHQAVTRGLDPSVPLKPSGINWLGDIPEHWSAVRFKNRVGFQEGPGIMAVDFRDSGVPLLRISCVKGEEVTLSGCNYLDEEMVERKWNHFRVRPGDYLLSASASSGEVSFVTETVMGSIPYTGLIRLWQRHTSTYMPFVAKYISSTIFQAQINAFKSGVGIEHFGPTHLKRMWIAMPPHEEQSAIVRQINERQEPLIRAISRAHAEIDLIREYRTRLVADVVTGQLDVRQHPWANTQIEDAIEAIPDDLESDEGPDDEESGDLDN